jgi:hypothetical protein
MRPKTSSDPPARATCTARIFAISVCRQNKPIRKVSPYDRDTARRNATFLTAHVRTCNNALPASKIEPDTAKT